jgi:hypothetical protein
MRGSYDGYAMTMSEEQGTRGRNETRDEQLDRNWYELLQELRVMQTGVQLLAGFLVTLPFQSGFDDLDDYQVRLYLGVLVLASVTTLMMMVPIAVHRRLFGRGVKEWLVATAHPMAQVVLGAVGLLIVGVASLVIDVVLGRTAGQVAGAVLLGVAVLLLVVLPLVVERASGRSGADS